MFTINKVYILWGGDVAESTIIDVYSEKEIAEKVKDDIGDTGDWDSYYIEEVEVTDEYNKPNFSYHLSIKYYFKTDTKSLRRGMSYKRIVDESYNRQAYIFTDIYDDYITLNADSNKSFLHAYELIKEKYKELKDNV